MKKIIIVIFALCLFNSCDDDIVSLSSDESNSSQMKPSADPKGEGVTVPFKSHFYTKLVDFDLDACGDADAGINYQEGDGEATHLGRLFTHMEFCHDFTPIPGNTDHPDPEYHGVPYWEYTDGTGHFLAANGDMLTFEMAGRVYIFNYDPGNLEETDLRWDDPFIFTGGTGRFVGASGEGSTHSYSDDGVINHHNWTGTLTLVK